MTILKDLFGNLLDNVPENSGRKCTGTCGRKVDFTTGKNPGPKGILCDDCYYAELGDIIEQNPIVSIPSRLDNVKPIESPKERIGKELELAYWKNWFIESDKESRDELLNLLRVEKENVEPKTKKMLIKLINVLAQENEKVK